MLRLREITSLRIAIADLLRTQPISNALRDRDAGLDALVYNTTSALDAGT